MQDPHLGKVRFKALQILLLAQEMGSLRAVAQAVNTSQPAVTQMMQELEKTFGQTLLNRERTGVSLTPAGLLLAARARVSLSEMATAFASLKAALPVPILRLGTLPFLMFDLLPRTLRTLQQDPQQMPRLRVQEATEGQLRQRLIRGDDDLILTRLTAVALDGQAFADMRIHELAQDMLTLFVGQRHPLYKRARQGKPVEAMLLVDCQWALPHESTQTRQYINEMLVQEGLAPVTTAVEVSSLNGRMLLVSETHLVSAGPLSAVKRMTSLLKLAPLRVKGAPSALTRTVAIHHARHDHNPEIDRFLAAMTRTVLAGQSAPLALVK